MDVNESEWDCTLEHNLWRGQDVHATLNDDKRTWGVGGPAVRLGFRQIKRFHVASGQRIVETRNRVGRFTSIEHFHRETNLPRHSMIRLAEADAFTSLGLSRRQALWQAMALPDVRRPAVRSDCAR